MLRLQQYLSGFGQTISFAVYYICALCIKGTPVTDRINTVQWLQLFSFRLHDTKCSLVSPLREMRNAALTPVVIRVLTGTPELNALMWDRIKHTNSVEQHNGNHLRLYQQMSKNGAEFNRPATLRWPDLRGKPTLYHEMNEVTWLGGLRSFLQIL